MTMTLTLNQLIACMPAAVARAPQFLPWVNTALGTAEANTRDRVCMFLATVAFESDNLLHLEENLNYSAEGLCRTWPSRFPSTKSAMTYEKNPQKIANKVYALRGGNGDEASGDGWAYRGAGCIQLTFKMNHAACARFFGKEIGDMAAWLRTPEGACLSAAWFWKTRGCNDYADHRDFDGVCDLVNIGRKTAPQGDALGFVDRLACLRLVQSVVRETI